MLSNGRVFKIYSSINFYKESFSIKLQLSLYPNFVPFESSKMC